MHGVKFPKELEQNTTTMRSVRRIGWLPLRHSQRCSLLSRLGSLCWPTIEPTYSLLFILTGNKQTLAHCCKIFLSAENAHQQRHNIVGFSALARTYRKIQYLGIPDVHRGAGIAQSVQWLGYGLDDRRSIPGRGRDLSLCHRIKTGSEAHPASYGAGRSFLRYKAAGLWS